MSPELGHRTADVHQPEPADSADRVVHHSVAEVRRRAERRPDRVPDQPGAVTAHTLPAGHVRAGHIRGEGVPRTAARGRNNERVLRGGQPDGQVRHATRQVHDVLHAVPQRRGAQGRERHYRHLQDEAHHRVCRPMPDRVQGGHQLPAAHRGARRRPG